MCTNRDQYTASPYGSHLKLPGCGATMTTLITTTGIEPITTGKPNTFCFESIMNEHQLQKSEILFIGDNLKTDIKFSNSAEVDCFLVLTGVTRKQTLEEQLADPAAGTPTYIGEDLAFEQTN